MQKWSQGMAVGGLAGWGRAEEVDTPVRHTARLDAHPAERHEEGRGPQGACGAWRALCSTAASRGTGAGAGAWRWGRVCGCPRLLGCVCPSQHPRCSLRDWVSLRDGVT